MAEISPGRAAYVAYCAAMDYVECQPWDDLVPEFQSAMEAAAEAGRNACPAGPPLEVRPGGAVVLRPDGGEVLVIAFAPDVPPERAAEPLFPASDVPGVNTR